MASIGAPGLIIIIIVALIVFGPDKLPEIGRTVGKTVREFRKAKDEIMSDIDPRTPPKQQAKKETTSTSTADSDEKKEMEEK